MNVLLDENIQGLTERALGSFGHKVFVIRGTEYQGLPDDRIWEYARQKKCLFVTTDKGFRRYRNENKNGILIVRLRKPNRQRIHERIMRGISQYEPEDWSGLLLVMRDKVRSTSRARD